MSSINCFDKEHGAHSPSLWQAVTMAGTEWEQLVDALRERAREQVRPVGSETQGSFADRAGVSRPHFANWLRREKALSHEFCGGIAEALGLRIADLALGLAPSLSIVGSINAMGVASFISEPRMGRFELVEALPDQERPLPKGAILVAEPANSPVPDRWNLIRVGGALRLARVTSTSGEPLLRFAGERVRQEFTPEVHGIEGFVAWLQYPGD